MKSKVRSPRSGVYIASAIDSAKREDETICLIQKAQITNRKSPNGSMAR